MQIKNTDNTETKHNT